MSLKSGMWRYDEVLRAHVRAVHSRALTLRVGESTAEIEGGCPHLTHSRSTRRMCWKLGWVFLGDGGCGSGGSWYSGGGCGVGDTPPPPIAKEGFAGGGLELMSVGLFLNLRASCMDRLSAWSLFIASESSPTRTWISPEGFVAPPLRVSLVRGGDIAGK